MLEGTFKFRAAAATWGLIRRECVGGGARAGHSFPDLPTSGAKARAITVRSETRALTAIHPFTHVALPAARERGGREEERNGTGEGHGAGRSARARETRK